LVYVFVYTSISSTINKVTGALIEDWHPSVYAVLCD